MIDLPIRPEARQAAIDAVERLYEPGGASSTEADVDAAIAAFCEAERLTAERRFATYDVWYGPSDPQQRLVGEWTPHV